MKTIISVALLLFSMCAMSQNCKYQKNDIDKFTGKMTKLTKKVKLIETFNSEGFVVLKKEDEVFSLILNYRTSFSKNVTVNDGAELSFLLDNGGIVTLKRKNGEYPITKDLLIALTKNKSQTLRYYYTDSNNDYKYSDTEIKKGNAEDFIELIKCVI